MKDMNGITLKAGDVVRIENAYFKNDNGYWFVEQDGTNEAYLDRTGLTLRKISKNGKISTAKNSINFFPLMATCNSWIKKAEANEWNEEHATIEKVENVNNAQIIERFEKEIAEYKESVEYYELRGYGEAWTANYKNNIEYLTNAVNRMNA